MTHTVNILQPGDWFISWVIIHLDNDNDNRFA